MRLATLRAMTLAAHDDDAPVSVRRDRVVAAVVYGLPVVVLVLLDRAAITKPLWSDEWATWQYSGLGWADLWRATSHVDRDLLPYYAIVHVARDLGFGIEAVRLVSLALGAVAVTATQLVARRLWGRVAALVAGLALAANPVFCLWVSQARPTACAYAVVALGSWLAVARAPASRVLYPVVVTLGALIFPTTVLAVPAQLFWIGRSTGRAVATRTAVVVLAGVATVAAWELLWVGQVSELVVASGAGVADVLRSMDHALGAEAALPWLHVVAVAVALAVVVGQRGAAHEPARRGVVFALLLTEGAAALAWLATAVGVPMLADNLLVAVPIGAALLLAGLIGHAWFEPANADADLGIAVRGGLALATVLSLAFAGSWWLDRARSEVSLDGMEFVARTLADQARPGDVLILQQPYSTVGYTASLAAALHDRALQVALTDQLPSGAERVVVRRVTEVDPRRPRVATVASTPARDATRVWVVHLPLDPVARSYRSTLACANPAGRHAQVIQTDLELLVCPDASS